MALTGSAASRQPSQVDNSSGGQGGKIIVAFAVVVAALGGYMYMTGGARVDSAANAPAANAPAANTQVITAESMNKLLANVPDPGFKPVPKVDFNSPEMKKLMQKSMDSYADEAKKKAQGYPPPPGTVYSVDKHGQMHQIR